MKPSEALAAHRNEVQQAVLRFRAINPRVFGSALHGLDQEGSGNFQSSCRLDG